MFFGRTSDDHENDLKEIALDIGYKNMEILSSTKKIIKPNSVTFDSIPYINAIYPYYTFEKIDDEKFCCNILIAKFNK